MFTNIVNKKVEVQKDVYYHTVVPYKRLSSIRVYIIYIIQHYIYNTTLYCVNKTILTKLAFNYRFQRCRLSVFSYFCFSMTCQCFWIKRSWWWKTEILSYSRALDWMSARRDVTKRNMCAQSLAPADVTCLSCMSFGLRLAEWLLERGVWVTGCHPP